MKSEVDSGTGLVMCSERRGMMTAWWQWSGGLEGREKSDDLKQYGGGQRKGMQAREVNYLGRSRGDSTRKGWFERKIQPYAPRGAEKTN